MTSPPRFALWLIGLFSPDEAIPGDLLEEFSTVASNNGTRHARRWFWRQSGRTIAHLAWSQFRLAPWSTLATVLAGYLFVWLCVPPAIVKSAGVLLGRYPVYEYVSAPAFWWICDVLVGEVIAPMLVGLLVARLSKNREMLVTSLLVGAIVVVGGTTLLSFLWWPLGPHSTVLFWHTDHVVVLDVLIGLMLMPSAILMGGIVSRKGGRRRLSIA
jgi:hypothetical protein